jgi:POT family proton-dependent oligopeptide transporter
MTDSALLYQTLPQGKTTFGGHPRALRTLFLTEMWERFSYYGMRALLMLYMVAPKANGGLGFAVIDAAAIYGWYTSLVYLTSLPGGYLADTFLGQRTSVVIGGAVIALGHFCLALPTLGSFYLGLGLIVLGTGLLKPNVSTLVGGLYAPGDLRRDGGFSIFYMGINLGAMIAPIACGYLAQSESFLGFLSAHGLDPHLGWHFGFACAGLGMVFGVLQFVLGIKNFGEVGARPSNPMVATPTVGIATTSAGPKPLTRDDWTRLAAIVVLFLFASLFWAAYEQAGSSLNLFADQLTDNRILGYAFPSSWLQSVNSIFIIVLSPVFGWLWVAMGKHQPSSPAKFALGLLCVAVSFFIVAEGAKLAHDTGGKVSPWWLIAVYLFSTLGELCVSPVGLSTVTKLAPARFAALMMGVWFLSLAAGNKLGGFIAGHYDPNGSLPWLFLTVAFFSLGAAFILALLLKPIRKLMAGVQ